jgi:hypothetical protein
MDSANVSAALRQIDRIESDPLDRIADAQARACTAAEERFVAFLKCDDEMDARTLASLAITRLVENTTPEELISFLSPFDPLLRESPRA